MHISWRKIHAEEGSKNVFLEEKKKRNDVGGKLGRINFYC